MKTNLNTLNITTNSIEAMTPEQFTWADEIIKGILNRTLVDENGKDYSDQDYRSWKDYLFGDNEISASRWQQDLIKLIEEGQQAILKAGEEGRLALNLNTLEEAFCDDSESALYPTLLFTLGVITPEGDILPSGEAIAAGVRQIEGLMILPRTDEEVIKAFIVAASMIF